MIEHDNNFLVAVASLECKAEWNLLLLMFLVTFPNS